MNLISSTGLGQRESNEENCGNIEVTTLISKLQTRCIIARDSTYNLQVIDTQFTQFYLKPNQTSLAD